MLCHIRFDIEYLIFAGRLRQLRVYDRQNYNHFKNFTFMKTVLNINTK